MTKSFATALLLPALGFWMVSPCRAQSAMADGISLVAKSVVTTNSAPASSSLVDAPEPVLTGFAIEAADPAMGVYPVQSPEAMRKDRGFHALDWTLLGAAAATRVLDFTSTEKALTEPQYFHEAVLPNALVHNKPAFAAFQAGTVAVNYEAYRFLVHHNLRSIARVSQYMYVGVMTFQVSHNYQLLANPPAN
jgi:hypothetical protein